MFFEISPVSIGFLIFNFILFFGILNTLFLAREVVGSVGVN